MRNPVEAEALKHAFLTAVPLVQNASANREGDFYFCYPKYKTVDDIYGLMRDCIRRYGAKWICIDNIQRLCDTTLGDKGRTQHLSEISKVISQIAKDYNVQIIRILQPHRIKAGALATSDNVDGASQIGKDCDCMMVLHRERTGGELTAQDVKDMGYVYEETSFGDEMVVTCPVEVIGAEAERGDRAAGRGNLEQGAAGVLEDDLASIRGDFRCSCVAVAGQHHN